MRVDVRLVNQPSVDFATLLSLGQEAFGRNLAARCDASGKILSSAERLISCLNSLNNPSAPPSLRPEFLAHVSFGVVITADSFELLEILECASGLPFVRAETKIRGVDVAFVTGTLAQWRDAALAGTNREGICKMAYCKIVSLFVQAGLNVWEEYTWRHDPKDGNQFLIEDRRR